MRTIAFSGSFPNCRTSTKDKGEEDRGRLNLPCQFPFTLRNKTYWACTFDYSHITGYKPWCSTKVDRHCSMPSYLQFISDQNYSLR